MSLAQHVATYCDLLVDASTDNVYIRSPQQLSKAVEIAVYVECEMAALDAQEVTNTREEASKLSENSKKITHEMLLDAHHTLYKALISNSNTANEMFWHIINSYRFLNRPEETCQEIVLEVSYHWPV
ncbi:hypothetical protein INT43_006822 [Umbelopsis isabellina]|uniref:Uncharacterized protein n=1 Tax=Mortierella isabellina TaxID=91625 RepID=A0A8H7Q361_MORIS|nr:hypothetical protein INT43_006822 [Umbelopsis isabellina]